jgi:hypothetical protein
MTPNAQKSTSKLYASPDITSGDMYCTVPT